MRLTLMTILVEMAMQTNSSQELRPLQIPALRAHKGNQIYYVTVLRLRDVVERVEVPQSQGSEGKNQQKTQEFRSNKIRDYLLLKSQKLCNTLVIKVCSGSPRWFELEIQDNNLFSSKDLLPHLNGMLGILYLHGSEKLLVADGKNIVIGMSKALEIDNSLESEEVSAIFVSHSA